MSHSVPLELPSAARAPRPRRGSLELDSKCRQRKAAFQAGSSIKQRLRQRRFSIAIGESIPLRTIKEGQCEDVFDWDQSPVAGRARLSNCSSSQHNSSTSGSSRDSSSPIPPLVLQDVHSDGLAGQQAVRSASFSTPGAVQVHSSSLYLPYQRQSSWHPEDQQQQQQQERTRPRQMRRQSHPPQVLHVHHQDGHTLTGLSQEQIWYHLQQQRREQQEQQLWQQQQARREQQAPSAPVPPQQQALPPSPQQAAQPQQQQDVADEDFAFWAQSQHHDDDLKSLQRQLQELSYTRPDNPATLGSITSNSAAASSARAQRNQQCQQLAAEHFEALAALHEIESELQQLFSMQDRLAAARAIAAPGSRAAAVCESALMRHQAVLQQALVARQGIASAVYEAAVNWGDMRGVQAQQGGAGAQWDAAVVAEFMGMCGSNQDLHLDVSGREGFDAEPLYPADAESLLQHFGHYAII